MISNRRWTGSCREDDHYLYFNGHPRAAASPRGTYASWPKGGKWIKPRKVRVFFGPAIHPEEFALQDKGKPDYDRIVALVMERIAALKEQASGVEQKMKAKDEGER